MIRAIRREPLRRRGAALSVCLYHTRFSGKKKDESAEKCSRPGKNGAGGGSCLPGGRHVVSGILALGSEIEGDDDGENGDKISGAHLAGDRQKDKQAGEGQSDDALDAQEVIDPPPEQGVLVHPLLSLHSMQVGVGGRKNCLDLERGPGFRIEPEAARRDARQNGWRRCGYDHRGSQPEI